MFMSVIPSYVVTFGWPATNEYNITIQLRVSGIDGVKNMIDILAFNNIDEFDVKREVWPNDNR